MAKLWTGRTDGITDALADDFNASITFDSRMIREDITGSMAHAAMLGRQGIITEAEADTLIDGLEGILTDLKTGALAIDYTSEDVHTFVEQTLTQRLGDVGKKLHTARSRNDQVALDLRLYLRQQIKTVQKSLTALITALTDKAETYYDAVMPGYTHLQRAQPVTLGHHLMAYVMMLLRDSDRLKDAAGRMNVCPIGSCALAGTTYDTDRVFEAARLGFDKPCLNSMDGVSDRDFCVELLSALSLTMMHLSRLSEELVLWSSWEFRFVQLSDAFTTGSSIMPQKKNPDMAELIRGKTGRVYGDLVGLLTVLKGLPLAYNKDMQEDKEAVFDAFDTTIHCLDVMTGMMQGLTADTTAMRKAASGGFINATDLADYLVGKGLPFRSAYKIAGQIVTACIAGDHTLESFPLEQYRQFSDIFDTDVYEAVSLDVCLAKRTSLGGSSPQSVARQIKAVREQLATGLTE